MTTPKPTTSKSTNAKTAAGSKAANAKTANAKSMPKAAKDIMHPGAECVPDTETLDRAAQMMRDMQVGSLPICGADDKLKGIITDRDIVVKCVAAGKDPSKVTAGELAQGTPVWVEATANEDDVLSLMEKNKIRRVPVMEDKRIVGMISEADLAQHLSDEKLARFVTTVTAAPPTKVK